MGLELDDRQLNLLFPAYIRVGRDLTFRSVGKSLRRLAPWIEPGGALLDAFRIERPAGGVDFEG